MDTKINDGGPAFPFPSGPEPRVDEFHERCEGMTLRDYFAAKAMAGLISRKEITTSNTHDELALVAYDMADAMLAARKENEDA